MDKHELPKLDCLDGHVSWEVYSQGSAFGVRHDFNRKRPDLAEDFLACINRKDSLLISTLGTRPEHHGAVLSIAGSLEWLHSHEICQIPHSCGIHATNGREPLTYDEASAIARAFGRVPRYVITHSGDAEHDEHVSLAKDSLVFSIGDDESVSLLGRLTDEECDLERSAWLYLMVQLLCDNYRIATPTRYGGYSNSTIRYLHQVAGKIAEMLSFGTIPESEFTGNMRQYHATSFEHAKIALEMLNATDTEAGRHALARSSYYDGLVRIYSSVLEPRTLDYRGCPVSPSTDFPEILVDRASKLAQRAEKRGVPEMLEAALAGVPVDDIIA